MNLFESCSICSAVIFCEVQQFVFFPFSIENWRIEEQCLALLVYSKKTLGSNPPAGCVEPACSASTGKWPVFI